MQIKQFDIWLANLNPAYGTEPGKTRPVVIIQTDLLNNIHPSTIICPASTKIVNNGEPLRIHLEKGQTDKSCDILIDQVRAVDNRRLVKKIGHLSVKQVSEIRESLKIVLDLI